MTQSISFVNQSNQFCKSNKSVCKSVNSHIHYNWVAIRGICCIRCHTDSCSSHSPTLQRKSVVCPFESCQHVWCEGLPGVHYRTWEARVGRCQGNTTSPSVATSARYCAMCPVLCIEKVNRIPSYFSTFMQRQHVKLGLMKPGWGLFVQEECYKAESHEFVAHV